MTLGGLEQVLSSDIATSALAAVVLMLTSGPRFPVPAPPYGTPTGPQNAREDLMTMTSSLMGPAKEPAALMV